jgi:hypothetical protein
MIGYQLSLEAATLSNPEKLHALPALTARCSQSGISPAPSQLCPAALR